MLEDLESKLAFRASQFHWDQIAQHIPNCHVLRDIVPRASTQGDVRNLHPSEAIQDRIGLVSEPTTGMR